MLSSNLKNLDLMKGVKDNKHHKQVELAGKMTLANFRDLVRTTNFLTLKEKNLIIRETNDELVTYSNWFDIVYAARFTIAKSKFMDNNKDNLQEALLLEFLSSDQQRTGFISIYDASKCLRRCKKLALTPF